MRKIFSIEKTSKDLLTKEWRDLLFSKEPSLELKRIRKEGMLPQELKELIGTPQDERFHPEGDVWSHTMLSIDAAADIIRREELEGDDALVVMLATLCHDFGKPETTEKKEGHWRAYGHGKAGEGPTRSFLSNLEIGEKLKKRIVPLVVRHMFPLNAEAGDSAIRRLIKKLEPATIRELVLVSEADIRGTSRSNPDLSLLKKLMKKAKKIKNKAEKPEQILQGRHLIEMGWKPGKIFGEILSAVYEAQLQGKVTNLEEAKEMAKKIKSNF